MVGSKESYEVENPNQASLLNHLVRSCDLQVE